MNHAIIALGSNIDPEENIRKARTILAQTYTILSESRFVRTKPVGYTDQPDFINGSVLIETPLTAAALKQELCELEQRLGRTKTGPRFGPRTIDLDIVVWNAQIIDPDVYARGYLKTAVLELLPELKY